MPESVEPGLRLAQWLPRRFPDVAADTWADRLRRGLVVDAEGQPLSGEEAWQRMSYAPILSVNVALTNWRFLYELGFSACLWHSGLGFSFPTYW